MTPQERLCDDFVRTAEGTVLEYFGIENQLKKLVEEATEVLEAGTVFNTDESSNIMRRRGLRLHVVEEIADLAFVLDQIREYYGVLEEEEEEWRDYKKERTLERIANGYYKQKEE